MKIISMFNNKGGVGKTTLTYHLAHILAEMGKKILILDLDPQCNISLYGIQEDELEKIWRDEELIIDNGFDSARREMKDDDWKNLFNTTRTIHFILKSSEEGVQDFFELPPPFKIADNLDLIPGRLTLFMYENKIAERWNGMFLGESLSIRTVTRIRKLAELYSVKNGYDFVFIDIAPSFGALNKVIISTIDGFMIPCSPDMSSLYSIKNIGKILTKWRREFTTCFSIVSSEKRKEFPERFVRFLGYTIYDTMDSARSNLAQAYSNYARQIPETIKEYIDESVRENLSDEIAAKPIGNMWAVSDGSILKYKNKSLISINNGKDYKAIKAKYEVFANDFLERLKTLDA